ncbi:MAG: histidinol dehydrogenase [Arcanobacterium sp.]|nr:histidinol dehydrogenase [Arcanobacterium sp.]
MADEFLRTIDVRGKQFSRTQLAAMLPRAAVDVEQALKAVLPIIDRVRSGGARVLRDLAEHFDGVRPLHLRVPQEALDTAEASLSDELRTALEISIVHNQRGHRAQLPQPATTEITPGGIVRQRWIPVERVGLYVPGGLAVYPSSVIHNVVAAQVAGVRQIALASPPQKAFGGLPHPTILAACKLLGITEVYAVGGAQAIAMFAYGAAGEAATSDGSVLCEPVDVVTGPGNIYVAAAKRAVHGIVGIDAEAGTTEIGIIADRDANPEFVAADMLSQAEHDPAAASVLITDSPELAAAVDQALIRQAAETKHAERVRQALTGPQSGVVLTDSLADSVAVANAYGAEHLEIHTRDAATVAQQIHNAGAVFVGAYSPVPLGDYMAGSNHVLPTGGTARFTSGLNVMAYIKSVQEIEYTQPAMAELYEPLRALALDEDLPAHAHSLQVRVEQQYTK